MSRIRPVLLAAALILAAALPALAHKVTIFAYVEDGQVVVDAFYSRSNKVRAGKILVADAASGEKYLEIVTDEAGAARFPIPEKALAARRDLKLTLAAGEGHQDGILVRAGEFGPAPKAPAPAKPEPRSEAAPGAVKEPKAASQPVAQAAPQMAPAELEALVERAAERAAERAVEKKVAPLRQMLERQAGDGPGLVEIVGGIGYILGLFGVAAFFAARRRERERK